MKGLFFLVLLVAVGEPVRALADTHTRSLRRLKIDVQTAEEETVKARRELAMAQLQLGLEAQARLRRWLELPNRILNSIQESIPPAVDAAHIDRLISQLGSRKFSQRVQAAKALEAIGKPALSHLRQAARSNKDLEIQRRAALLVRVLSPPPAPAIADEEGTSLRHLANKVRERGQQMASAQCDLGRARGRLALAEGKKELAISELRKVATYYEKRLQELQANLGRFCDPRLELEIAERPLAEARADLAQAEEKPEVLVRELQKIVILQERKLRRIEDLAQKSFIATVADIIEFQDELAQIYERLETAQKRLRPNRKDSWQ